MTNAFLAGVSDTLSQTWFAPPTQKSRADSFRSGATYANERGLQGAKDMSEGDSKAEEERLLSGKDAVEDRLSVTSYVSSSSSSVVEQSAVSFDIQRTGRFMFYNFSVAPLIHTWFTFLDRNFPINPSSNPSVNFAVRKTVAPTSIMRAIRTMTPAIKRMMTDQIFFAPVGLALMFSGLTVLEGGGIQEIKNKLDNAFLSTLKANYAVWPLVQLVNFGVMPLQLRLPFVSVIGIAWNAYVSLANSKGRQEEKPWMVQEQEMIAVAS